MKRCSMCDGNTRIKQRSYSCEIKNEKIDTFVNEYVCDSCGFVFTDFEMENDNINRGYEIYKKNHNLLSSGEIKEIRNSRGLTQKEYANILGAGEKTIARYENGAIQDKAMDNLIRLSDDDKNFSFLVKRANIKINEFATIKVLNTVYRKSARDKFITYKNTTIA